MPPVTGHTDDGDAVLVLLEEPNEVPTSVVDRVSSATLDRRAVFFQRRQCLKVETSNPTTFNNEKLVMSETETVYTDVARNSRSKILLNL